jgi:transcription initiation factor IIE alpha subunit
VEARLLIAVPGAKTVNLNRNQSTTKSRRTYFWMVVRQHAPQKLKRLLFNRKSILVPPKARVRGG